MEQVNAYKAADGVLFNTEEEATRYEIGLAWAKRMNEFQQSPLCPYPAGAQNGMMRKIIISWEQYKAKNTP